MEKPTDHVARKLNQVQVEVQSLYSFSLRCKKCGAVWSPNLKEGGRLPKRYWQCPNGCNANLG